MGWVPTRHEGRIPWQMVGGRVRASAEPTPELSPRQIAPLLDGAVSRGVIPAEDWDAWERHLTADPVGALQLIAERERQLAEATAQAANSNGALHAAGRREVDGERLVASAIRAGKFSESRHEFWLSRYRNNPEATRTTIEALEPLPPFLAAKGTTGGDAAGREQAEHERAFAAAFPNQARQLRYRVAERRTRIRDRS